MAARKTRTPVVKLDGTLLADDIESDLVDLRVTASVHHAASAELRFIDSYYELFDRAPFKVGTDLEVLLPDASNSLKSVFSGAITTLGIEHLREDGAYPTMLVEARSYGHVLAVSSEFTTYLDASVDDVVGAIASRCGLTAKTDGLPSGQLAYLLQAGTDHRMLNDLASRFGFEWTTDGKDLVARARKGEKGPTLSRTEDLLRFSAVYTGIHTPKTLTVHGWDPQTQEAFSGAAGSVVSGPSADELGSSAPFVADAHGKAVDEFGKDLVIGTPAALDAKEAEALADAIGLSLISRGLEVEGVAFADPAIVPGGTVTIDEVGTKLAGDYYVTEVTHEFSRGSETVTVFRTAEHHHEPALLAAGPGGPDSWGLSGLVLGVVTNVNDEEQLGRVKVWFPSLGEENESDWARVVIPGVGEERGFDARPEVGDEVVVGFDRGDLRFPFVLGGVWSAKQPPPEKDTSADGFVTRRQIVSRVGHQVTLSDGPDGAADGDPDRYVEIALADGTTKLRVGEEKVELVTDALEIKLTNGDASITLTEEGDVEIDAKNVKLTSKMDVKVDAGANLAANAKAKLALASKGGFEAGGAMVKVVGKGITEIKGSMVKIN